MKKASADEHIAETCLGNVRNLAGGGAYLTAGVMGDDGRYHGVSSTGSWLGALTP